MFLSVHKEAVLTLVLLTIMFSNLCMAPEVAYAKFNEAISLRCTLNSNLVDIEWYHQKIGTTQDRTVYLDKSIYLNYKERFSVSCNERTCELNILNVSSTDAGKYSCKHNEATTFVELIVFEVYPSDESCFVPEVYKKPIIRENVCNIALADAFISCEMKYYGNKVPEMVWTDNYKQITRGLSVRKDERNIIYSTVQLTALSTTNITCTIQFSELNITSSISWMKRIEVVALSNSSTKDITNCSSGDQICQTVENCRPQWMFPNGTFISSSDTLVLKDLESGDYECNNVCDIRGRNCVIRQRTIIYVCNTNSETETETSHTATIVGIVFGIIFAVAMVVAMVVAAVFFIPRVIHIRREHRENGPTEAGNDVAKPLTSPNENEKPGPLDASR